MSKPLTHTLFDVVLYFLIGAALAFTVSRLVYDCTGAKRPHVLENDGVVEEALEDAIEVFSGAQNIDLSPKKKECAGGEFQDYSYPHKRRD